jgi:hypothetical protein
MLKYIDGFNRPVTIVETGCASNTNNWPGEGHSTVIFDRFVCSKPGSVVYSMDIDSNVTNACQALVSSNVKV